MHKLLLNLTNQTDYIIIESYVGPSSEGPGKGVKMSAEFQKYATDKIKKGKQENEVAKENKKATTKQTQDLPALRSQRTKLFFTFAAITFQII